MQANTFKRNAYKTLDAKATKTAYRVELARKTPTAFASRAALQLKSETSRLLAVAQPYILGEQLDDELREALTEALGTVYMQAAILSRVTKAKMIGSGKKIVLKGMTTTEATLELDAIALHLQDLVLDTFNGKSLDLQAMKTVVEGLLFHLQGLTYMLLRHTPTEVLARQQAILEQSYGTELFATVAAKAK